MNFLEKLPELDLAPRWLRLIHVFVDAFVILLLGKLLWRFLVSIPELEALLDPLLADLKGLHRRMSNLILMFVYYLVMEVGFRTTIAKMFTRTVITDAEGGLPGRRQLLIRTLCRFIPFEPLSFLDRNGKGLHDSISRTYVVRHRATPSSAGTSPRPPSD